MKPSEILLAAADRLEKKGWIQGSYIPIDQGFMSTHIDDIGPSDLTGAIRIAAGGHHEKANDEAATHAKELVRDAIGGGSLGLWNDEDGRTIEEVIGILRLAAERARATTA